MKLIKKGCQLDALGKKVCCGETRFVLCGTDDFGERFYTSYARELAITKVYHGSFEPFFLKPRWCEPLEYSAIPPYEIGVEPIIITARRAKESNAIAGRLEELGYRSEESYFRARQFESIYQAYAHDKIYLSYAEIMITELCTLNCKNCCLFMPYYEKPQHMSFEAIVKNLDLFFTNVDYLFHFRLLGGEPLLHPDFAKIIAYVGEQYRDKIDYFDVATNATMIPSPETLEYARKYNVVFAISDYSCSVQTKLPELLRLLGSHGVEHRTTSLSTWFDLGFPLQRLGTAEERDGMHCFDSCKTQWRTIFDGKLFFCSVASSASRAGFMLDDPSSYIRLDRDIAAKEILEFDRGYSPAGYNRFCLHCGGYMPSANKNLVPAAQQTSKREARGIIHGASGWIHGD